MGKFSTMPLRFRVWDKDERCFVKSLGAFTYFLNTCLEYDTTTRLDFVENSGFIISQDTGFKDKNGKSIYTGDIVEGAAWKEEDGSGMEIIHHPPEKRLVMYYGGRVCGLNLAEPYKIIGNIWENPELLEEEDVEAI